MRASRGWRKWLRRILKTTLVLVLVMAVAIGGYVGFVAVRQAQPVTLPAPTGQYKVGRTTFEWTDHARTDPLAPQPGTPREISVWLWYPAAADANAQPAPYAPGDWAQLHFGGLAGLGESSFSAIRDHSLDGVPVAAGRFPTVVLEPGMGLSAPQYTTLAENVASHGYLVAGVTPTYSANVAVLHGHAVHATATGKPDNLGASPTSAAAQGDRLIAVWADDARFAADQVTTLDRSGPFAGHVDPAHTAYLGHSFGGAAALQTCATDPHCAGAVDLDGTQFGTVVHTGLHAPMMLMGSEKSCVMGTCHADDAEQRAERDSARSLVAASTGPTWCYAIKGTLHFNFSDYAAYYLAAPIRALVPLGPIRGEDGLRIINAYLTAFLDSTVYARPQPLLTGQSSPYPQVQAQCPPR